MLSTYSLLQLCFEGRLSILDNEEYLLTELISTSKLDLPNIQFSFEVKRIETLYVRSDVF